MSEKVYLFVPYGYSDEVKKIGKGLVSFDGNVKKWYVVRNNSCSEKENEIKQELIDNYHQHNFYRNDKKEWVFCPESTEEYRFEHKINKNVMSEEELNLIADRDKEEQEKIHQYFRERSFLYVPPAFSTEAKNDGAKYDEKMRKWYVLKDDINYKYLTDVYNSDNISKFCDVGGLWFSEHVPHYRGGSLKPVLQQQQEQETTKLFYNKSRYYYTVGDKVFSITDSDDNLVEETLKTKDIRTYHYYEAQKDYEASLEGLIEYRIDFNKWRNEMVKDMDYKKYFNHDSAVRMYFESKSKRQVDSLQLDDITYKEFSFYEKCPNSGLMSFDDTYKDKTVDCYGYDYSAFYPNCLLKIDLPTKQGKRRKLQSLDYDNLDYGIYHVKITCDDKRFKKIFMFSRHNHYTHYSLSFAHKFKDKFNVKMELVIDGNYNGLIYTVDKLVDSKDVFKKWFSDTSELKANYPKNKLVKRLMSSLWGSLTAFNRECYEDIEDLDISELTDEDPTEYKLLDEKRYADNSKEFGVRTVYYIIPSNKPYKNNLARLKPFLVSYCRSYVARMIMKENLLDNVIRIHTDGIMLNKQYDFTHLKYYPKPEDKSTGKIHFKNVINYEKV